MRKVRSGKLKVKGKTIDSAGDVHFEAGDFCEDGLAGVGHADVGALGGAVEGDDVVGAVGELLAGDEAGKLAYDAVALDYDAVAGGVGDDPFATFDGDGVRGLVADGDEVGEGVGTIGRGLEVGTVEDAVNADDEAWQIADFH